MGWDVQEQGKLQELLWVGGKAVVQCETTSPELRGAVVAQGPHPWSESRDCASHPSAAPEWDTFPSCRACQASGLSEPLHRVGTAREELILDGLHH